MSLSPSEEEEEDNRVAVIKYESERGDGGEREREREGLLPSFPKSRWSEGSNRKGAAQGTQASSGAAQALRFRFNK